MRKTFIKPHLTDMELKNRYENAVEPEIRKRWHMLWLVQAKAYFVTEASQIVGHDKSWGCNWVKQYNKYGSVAIVWPKLRNPKLAEKKVTDQMKADLLDKLSCPVPNEIGGGLWSGVKVALYIKFQFSIKISRKTGWKLLKECGYSQMTIRPKHKQSSDKKKEEFKKKLYQKK